MKTFKPLAILALLVSFFVLSGWHKPEKISETTAQEHVIVLLKFKAQPNKGAMAVSELMKLLEKVKQEPHL
jgi:hypothetical protein